MNYLVRLINFIALCCASLLLTNAASAADQGTRAEAESMVRKAIAYIKAQGAEKAYDEFTNGKLFKDRDLYIIAYDLSGKNLAHGANPKLVGKDLIGLKDPDGKPLIQMFVDLAKSNGKGWVEDFKFINPTSKKLENKSMYIERSGDIFIGCGVYKN